MPLPVPKSQEDSQNFITRCMESKVMQREYPDKKQRLAVAYSIIRQKRGKKTLGGK